MAIEIIKWLQSFSNPVLDFLFIWITQLGEETILILFFTWIYWYYDKEFGRMLGIGLVSTLIVNNGFKEFFDMPRPIGEDGIFSLRVETATGKSFPSGHSQLSATMYTMIRTKFNQRWLKILCSLAILLVGISRMYLGLHYPQDVLAGWIIGIGIAVVIYFGFGTGKVIYWYAAVLLVGLAFLPFSYSEDYYKSFGLMIGLILGFIIEERFVDFQKPESITGAMARMIVGIGVLIFLKTWLKLVLPETLLAESLRYFLVGIVGTGLYPLVFNKIDFFNV